MQVELTEALRRDGLAVAVEVETTSFVRLAVHAEGDARLEVEIAFDARMFPPVELQVGPVLSERELAADKALALFGRAYARDLVDVAALVDRLGEPVVLALAAEKDSGFSPDVFAQALAVAAGRPDEEFRRLGLSATDIRELRERAAAWGRRS